MHKTWILYFYLGVDESLDEPKFVKFESDEKIDIGQILKNKNSMDRHQFCLHPRAGDECDKKSLKLTQFKIVSLFHLLPKMDTYIS